MCTFASGSFRKKRKFEGLIAQINKLEFEINDLKDLYKLFKSETDEEVEAEINTLLKKTLRAVENLVWISVLSKSLHLFHHNGD